MVYDGLFFSVKLYNIEIFFKILQPKQIDCDNAIMILPYNTCAKIIES